ncbi:hypothetical protein FGADI_5737 [Fusarium gaditjirri]|uniref:Uncharacterized protein n=1 Tax=Fusarium gaditjirri TaxID=282569 RepID=A0A8H4T9K2_9HYPO|nr:hypothetical protein FGADI_5737 [Fusarium gaditjirri]
MSLMLTPMKIEAWLRLGGKSSRGQLALYGSSVLGVMLTLYWAGLVIYHIYFYSLVSYISPLLATSTPMRAWLLVVYLEAIAINSGKIWRIIRSTRGRIHLAIDEGHKKYGGL